MGLEQYSPDKRFWMYANPEPNTGCWLWSGSLTANGYGNIGVDNRRVLVHRFSYEKFVGPIGEGLEIDHLCKVRCCVNPDHLEQVTRLENVRRSSAGYYKRTPENNKLVAKTHCPKGHPYSGINLWTSKTGARQCRTCHRIRAKADYWAKRSATTEASL